eukprot:scaffold127377_cov75-Phaeocystis_antarctica.AAC.3
MALGENGSLAVDGAQRTWIERDKWAPWTVDALEQRQHERGAAAAVSHLHDGEGLRQGERCGYKSGGDWQPILIEEISCHQLGVLKRDHQLVHAHSSALILLAPMPPASAFCDRWRQHSSAEATHINLSEALRSSSELAHSHSIVIEPLQLSLLLRRWRATAGERAGYVQIDRRRKGAIAS